MYQIMTFTVSKHAMHAVMWFSLWIESRRSSLFRILSSMRLACHENHILQMNVNLLVLSTSGFLHLFREENSALSTKGTLDCLKQLHWFGNGQWFMTETQLNCFPLCLIPENNKKVLLYVTVLDWILLVHGINCLPSLDYEYCTVLSIDFCLLLIVWTDHRMYDTGQHYCYTVAQCK